MKLIENQPHNWLARVAYIQFYAIPQAEEEDYKSQKSHLEKFTKLHREEKVWMPENESASSPAFGEDMLRVYQTIAIKRFGYIKKYESDLF